MPLASIEPANQAPDGVLFKAQQSPESALSHRCQQRGLDEGNAIQGPISQRWDLHSFYWVEQQSQISGCLSHT